MAISVIIGTYNSSKHLRKVIDQVKDYDEVIVCDTGSNDDTVSIAREEGCALVVADSEEGEEFNVHTKALRSAKNDWILYLHGDELATQELREYLYKFTENPGEIHGLFIPQRHFLMHKEDTNYYPDFQLRFFHREGTAWNEGRDSLPSVYGRTGRIPANKKKLAIINIPGSINDKIGNLEENIGCSVTEGRNVPLVEIFGTTVGVFLKEYVMKGKLKYGTTGYIDSVNKAMKEYFRLAKLHENFCKDRIIRKFK